MRGQPGARRMALSPVAGMLGVPGRQAGGSQEPRKAATGRMHGERAACRFCSRCSLTMPAGRAGCVQERCKEWAKGGECKNNQAYMENECKDSCGLCPKKKSKVCPARGGLTRARPHSHERGKHRKELGCGSAAGCRALEGMPDGRGRKDEALSKNSTAPPLVCAGRAAEP
jgi:ShK domain-like